ncbi:MAG: hypothetical protein COW84_01030 [Gammaproteobacteria bacterium CG22_combo_CG10-13_8_21_14_all_40_8]|nr:MAG: hypothetical protein COW84_01030 [Gammaproteobacteria bacterium CG22_combo_CG10-13_8_21_14_all_40_8]
MNKNLLLGAAVAVVLSGCSSIDPGKVTRPAGTVAFSADRTELVAEGEKLWNNPNLGKSGLACNTCHMGGAQFKKTFKVAYPHKVAMSSSMAGLDKIDAEQMVQFCMLAPMKTEPLPWESKDLAALTAYVEDVAQPEFQAK